MSESGARRLPFRVLCIGAGFAGLEVMRSLGSDHRFELTVVDKRNHHTFQPLLYQVATASLAMNEIARTVRQVASPHANITVYQDEVVNFDLDGKRAIGKNRVYDYDALVIAAGAKTSFFGNDDWDEHVWGLKSLQEAYGIRRQVLLNLEKAERTDDEDLRRKWMTVAIVGGGPTGVELAGAFRDLVKRAMSRNYRRLDPNELKVQLFQMEDRLLPPFPEQQSAYTKQTLEEAGVEVYTSATVVDVQHEKLVLKDGREFEAGTLIWAAGVEAARLTRKLGVEPVGSCGRIEPKPDLSVPGRPEVFVVGDLTRMKDAEGKPVPGVAPAAIQMAACVCRHLKRDAARFEDGMEPLPVAERDQFVYFDKGMMAIIGKNAAVVSSGKMQMRGFMAWLAWLFVHVLSLVGFRNKVSVLLSWWSAYVHDRAGAQVVATEQVSPPPKS